jgi:ABC-2 type transport system ATP-binding protein
MCDHVAVMRAGRLVAQGSLDELRSAGQARVRVEVVAADAGAAEAVLARLTGTSPAETGADAPGGIESSPGPAGGERMLGAALPDGLPPETIVSELVAAGVRVRGFAVERASLEELFVELTGEGFDVVQ